MTEVVNTVSDISALIKTTGPPAVDHDRYISTNCCVFGHSNLFLCQQVVPLSSPRLEVEPEVQRVWESVCVCVSLWPSTHVHIISDIPSIFLSPTCRLGHKRGFDRTDRSRPSHAKVAEPWQCAAPRTESAAAPQWCRCKLHVGKTKKSIRQNKVSCDKMEQMFHAHLRE